MRRDQIAQDRWNYLVPAFEHPNALALVAPPTPRSIPDGERYHIALEKAQTALGRMQAAMALLPDADMITRTLARREAVSSSQIEGTRASLPQLLAYEATRSLDGTSPDVRITERYVVALQVGLDRVRTQGRKALTIPLLHEMHRTLMQDELGDFPKGAWRTNQVWIGSSIRIEDATFVPAPPDRIQACMEEFVTNSLQYAPREGDYTALTLIPQLAIAHAQFETVHPYYDGNGRTGRLLLPLLLAAEGYPPLYLSGSLLRSKDAYYHALAEVQLRGEWGPWIRLLSDSIVESSNDSIAIAVDLKALCDQWEQQLQRYRSDSATRRLPKLLLGHPVLSVQQAVELLDVSQPAANAALNNLVDAGILELVGTRKWGRIFQASRVLERIDRAP